MVNNKIKLSRNEQAKELILIFYPGSDIIEDFGEAYTNQSDWRWERAIDLSIKCCDKIIGALNSQRIQSLDLLEYWEDVKQILKEK